MPRKSTLQIVHVMASAVILAGLLPAADSGNRPMTEWYYADALAIPPNAKLDAPIHGAHGLSLEWMIVFNPGLKETTATVTHYFEDAPPVQKQVTVPARSSISIGGHGELPEELQPKKKVYGVRVQSAAPIVVQATRAEQEMGVKPKVMPGRSFLSRMAYAGPLGKKETAWMYCDSSIQRNNKNAVETEWLTVLNPGRKDAKVKVTFNYGKDGQTSYEFNLPAERVKTTALADVDQVKDSRNAGVLVESNVPVIVEQVRRYWYRWQPAPAGTWIVTGYPVGDVKFKLPSAP